MIAISDSMCTVNNVTIAKCLCISTCYSITIAKCVRLVTINCILVTISTTRTSSTCNAITLTNCNACSCTIRNKTIIYGIMRIWSLTGLITYTCKNKSISCMHRCCRTNRSHCGYTNSCCRS